jgi:hypothetical protein
MISCLSRKGTLSNSISVDELRIKVMDKYPELKLNQLKKLNKEKLCKLYYTDLHKKSKEEDTYKFDLNKNYKVEQLRRLLKHTKDISKLKTKQELIDKFISVYFVDKFYNPAIDSMKEQKEEIIKDKTSVRKNLEKIISKSNMDQKDIILNQLDKINLTEESFLNQITDLEDKMKLINDKLTNSYNLQLTQQINNLIRTLFMHLNNKDKKYQRIIQSIHNNSDVVDVLYSLQDIKNEYNPVVNDIISQLKSHLDKIPSKEIKYDIAQIINEVIRYNHNEDKAVLSLKQFLLGISNVGKTFEDKSEGQILLKMEDFTKKLEDNFIDRNIKISSVQSSLDDKMKSLNQRYNELHTELNTIQNSIVEKTNEYSKM